MTAPSSQQLCLLCAHFYSSKVDRCVSSSASCSLALGRMTSNLATHFPVIRITDENAALDMRVWAVATRHEYLYISTDLCMYEFGASVFQYSSTHRRTKSFSHRVARQKDLLRCSLVLLTRSSGSRRFAGRARSATTRQPTSRTGRRSSRRSCWIAALITLIALIDYSFGCLVDLFFF